MTKPRLSSFDRFILAVGIVLFLIGMSLALGSCASHNVKNSRPKYGDSTAPVGPSKDAFKTQPKFQP